MFGVVNNLPYPLEPITWEYIAKTVEQYGYRAMSVNISNYDDDLFDGLLVVEV